MTITVVNVRAAKQPFVYCGRHNRRLPQSPLANPFKLEREADREQVLDQYQQWFDEQITKGNKAFTDELFRLMELAKDGDVSLACWCAPKVCHCDIIKSWMEEHLPPDDCYHSD